LNSDSKCRSQLKFHTFHAAIVIDRIIIRPLDESDAIPPITRLLHEAYAPLAAMNLRYTATHQSDEVTRTRFARGLPWVAVLEEEIVATVTLYPVTEGDSGCPWYGKPGIFSFGQFAVRPDLQGQGLGSRLIALLENEAGARGASELALDTAEGALHLIRWYETQGFRFVEFMDWSSTNYRSVVMSKTLKR
jgi:predicted N-acetyltransferase YhbS